MGESTWLLAALCAPVCGLQAACMACRLDARVSGPNADLSGALAKSPPAEPTSRYPCRTYVEAKAGTRAKTWDAWAAQLPNSAAGTRMGVFVFQDVARDASNLRRNTHFRPHAISN